MIYRDAVVQPSVEAFRGTLGRMRWQWGAVRSEHTASFGRSRRHELCHAFRDLAALIVALSFVMTLRLIAR